MCRRNANGHPWIISHFPLSSSVPRSPGNCMGACAPGAVLLFTRYLESPTNSLNSELKRPPFYRPQGGFALSTCDADAGANPYSPHVYGPKPDCRVAFTPYSLVTNTAQPGITTHATLLQAMRCVFCHECRCCARCATNMQR